MMTLSDYLRFTRESEAAFARRAGISRQLCRMYCAGVIAPGREKMALIYKATKGLVTANDFHGHVPVPLAANLNRRPAPGGFALDGEKVRDAG